MSDLSTESSALYRWLFETALPLWWEVGADRSGGGFHEAIDFQGRVVALPHRARVIARQAYSYAEAGRLGWNGPWREAALHGLEYLRRHFVVADGTVVSVVALDGTVSDPTFDLYNQAFTLLAYASGHRAFGEAAGWRQEAVRLRTGLDAFLHPQGGFREDRAGRLPQRANPHMHLFEAALAWMAADGSDPAWRAMAGNIATLCCDKLIDPATGALREFFAADWSPAPGLDGRIVDPGHLYEWAFLLDRWARLTGRPRPDAVLPLIAFADGCSLDLQRNVAINAVLLDGSSHDPVARLWAQAERVRAYLVDRRAGDEPRIAMAIQGLRRFLATPMAGLWFDQLGADDRFIVEPARATSLYHILNAVAELSAAVPLATDGRPFDPERRRAPSIS